MECGKRCLLHRSPKDQERLHDDLVPDYSSERLKISASEQLCLNRCISKIMNVKEIVDTKLAGQIELPPILFNQNLP